MSSPHIFIYSLILTSSNISDSKKKIYIEFIKNMQSNIIFRICQIIDLYLQGNEKDILKFMDNNNDYIKKLIGHKYSHSLNKYIKKHTSQVYNILSNLPQLFDGLSNP